MNIRQPNFESSEEPSYEEIRKWVDLDFDETVKRVEDLREYDARALLVDLVPVQKTLDAYSSSPKANDAAEAVAKELGFSNLGEAISFTALLVPLLQHKAEPHNDDKNFEQQ